MSAWFPVGAGDQARGRGGEGGGDIDQSGTGWAKHTGTGNPYFDMCTFYMESSNINDQVSNLLR